MGSTPELDVIKDIPGYRVILKAILKSQIQQLVEQLANHTDEESVILTASVTDGTLSHLGSDSGKNFLEDHEDIKSQFLGFCLRKHHKKKQQEKEEKEQKEQQEREEALRQAQLPTTPSRQPPPRFSPRSPRFPSPRQPGVYPMALTRASPGGGPMRMRHEPYPRPIRRPSFDQQGPGQSPRMPISGQVIKIEAEDPDSNDNTSSAQNPSGDSSAGPASSQPFSPSHASAETSVAGLKREAGDKDDDAKSTTSSTSTIPNEASDLNRDSVPPEGLGLDSDFSSLMPPSDSPDADNQQQPRTPSSAPQTPGSAGSGLDSGVSVKVEAITESEMELEITGVELGPSPVQRQTSQEGWGPGPQGGGAGGYGGAAGSQADMQQGYRYPGYTENTQTVNFGEGTSPIRAHVCDMCGKPFPSQWELKRHVRTHTGEKPYKCDFCERAFADRSNMNQHVKIMHLKKPRNRSLDKNKRKSR